MADNWERDEWRAALRHNPAACATHHYTPTAGGGICTRCGDTIDTEEL